MGTLADMAEQPASRVLRFRYLGSLAHTLKIANVVEVDVKHGTIFDVPEQWAYALKLRGTPCEEVREGLDALLKAIAAASSHKAIDAAFERYAGSLSDAELEVAGQAARARFYKEIAPTPPPPRGDEGKGTEVGDPPPPPAPPQKSAAEKKAEKKAAKEAAKAAAAAAAKAAEQVDDETEGETDDVSSDKEGGDAG